MNNNFKMSGKPQMIFPSPYQRSITPTSLGRNMPSSIPSGSHMGSNMRPTIPVTPLRREFEDSPEPMSGSMAMSFDTGNSFNFMGFSSPSPSYRFTPNMQSMTGNIPFHTEFRSYSPPHFQNFSPMTTSMEEYGNSMMESFNFSHDEPSRVSEKKNQLMKKIPTPSTFEAKKSEQKVRFNLSEKTTGREKNSNNKDSTKSTSVSKKESLPKTPPLRILSGPIDKIVNWSGKLHDVKNILVDVIGSFVAIGSSETRHRKAKTFLLRDQNTPVLQCIFYEIDKTLPSFKKGQLVSHGIDKETIRLRGHAIKML